MGRCSRNPQRAWIFQALTDVFQYEQTHNMMQRTDKVNPVYAPSNFVGGGYNNNNSNNNDNNNNYYYCYNLVDHVNHFEQNTSLLIKMPIENQ